MRIYSYENYEEYRKEVSPKPPRTLEAHQKRLADALDRLYQQNDYRSLDIVFRLSNALGDDESHDLRCLMGEVIGAILRFDDRLRGVVKCFILGLQKQ